jgi:hypothetical protein
VFDGMINVNDQDNNQMATVDIENSNCLGLDQPHSMNITLPEGGIGRAYFSSAYEGTIRINGESLMPTGMGLEISGDLEVAVEFRDDHQCSNTMNVLRVTVLDTTNLQMASRALHFTGDCSSIVTSVIETDHNPINIFPNPTKNLVKVDLSRLLGRHVEIQMYNSVGQEVYWDRLIADERALQFAVASLPRGIYLIKVAYDKKQHTQRIVLD